MAATKKQVLAAWGQLNAVWNALDRAKAKGQAHGDVWEAWGRAWGPVCILRAIPKADYQPGDAEQALDLTAKALDAAKAAGLDWARYL